MSKFRVGDVVEYTHAVSGDYFTQGRLYTISEIGSLDSPPWPYAECFTIAESDTAYGIRVLAEGFELAKSELAQIVLGDASHVQV